MFYRDCIIHIGDEIMYKKIAIQIECDEKYPDFDFTRVDSADAHSWKHYGDIEGSDIIFVGRFLYWILLVAEKISEWYGGKLGQLFDRAHNQYHNHPNSNVVTFDIEVDWNDRFGDEEERLRLLTKQEKELSEFSREFNAKERMRKSSRKLRVDK